MIISSCGNRLSPAQLRNKSIEQMVICAMGVFRSHTPRAYLKYIIYYSFVSNVLMDIAHEHLRSNEPPIVICIFLMYYYRCVSRFCYKLLKGNHYHLKSGCIPTISRYSALAFSLSASDNAVFDFVYAS